MTLNEFLKSYSSLDLVSDSRKANTNAIFIAIRGTTSDGHNFLSEVYQKGCRYFIVEDDDVVKNWSMVHYLKVPNSRMAWAQAWKLKTENKLKDLFISAVTGTNGKTSITLMLEHILNSLDVSCAVLGTIDHHLEVQGQIRTWPSNLTTPGPEVLYPRLLEMSELGARAVAMEISSHALDQNRAEGLDVNVALFSNLTEDHLDYHPNLEHYFQSKLKLFENLLQTSVKANKVSILNYMDPWVRTYVPLFGQVEILAEISEPKINLIWLDSFKSALQKNPQAKLNLVQIEKHSLAGLQILLYLDVNPESQDLQEYLKTLQPMKFKLPVMGHFQALNWCQAVLASLVYFKNNNIEFSNLTDRVKAQKKIMDAAENFKGVPGRLQKILTKKPKAVFVDYAHTPDALERTLKSIKQVCLGKVVVVFGCGGDRDRIKRPIMADVAAKFSDIQIITSDNPRTENPESILADILNGFIANSFDFKDAKFFSSFAVSQPQVIHNSLSPIKIELDRKRAIQVGLELLTSSEDILLIAGKGHENYQILKNSTIAFSDYDTASTLIETM